MRPGSYPLTCRKVMGAAMVLAVAARRTAGATARGGAPSSRFAYRPSAAHSHPPSNTTLWLVQAEASSEA